MTGKKYLCKCGAKTPNRSGVCDNCREKLRLLGRIRRMIFQRNAPKQKEKTETKACTVFAHPNGKEQLCWSCEKASGKCSWSQNFTPVPGWAAVKTERATESPLPGAGESYQIRACPEFEPLRMKRRRKK